LASTLTDSSGVSTCTAPSVRFQYSQTASSARRAAGAPRKPVHVCAGIVPAPAGAHAEDKLPFLARLEFEADLDRRARIEGGTDPARQACAAIAAGPRRSVATKEFRAVARQRPVRVVDVEERDAIGKLGVVWIAREQRAGGSISVVTCIAVFGRRSPSTHST
jgi:hypothetical protein